MARTLQLPTRDYKLVEFYTCRYAPRMTDCRLWSVLAIDAAGNALWTESRHSTEAAAKRACGKRNRSR